MDVNIICYRLKKGMWTQGIYPLKLHEYLATGKPVVSSPLSSVKEFSAVVALADDVDQWHQRISSALRYGGVGTTAARRSVAQENDWSARVLRIRQLLDQLVAACAERCDGR